MFRFRRIRRGILGSQTQTLKLDRSQHLNLFLTGSGDSQEDADAVLLAKRVQKELDRHPVNPCRLFKVVRRISHCDRCVSEQSISSPVLACQLLSIVFLGWRALVALSGARASQEASWNDYDPLRTQALVTVRQNYDFMSSGSQRARIEANQN